MGDDAGRAVVCLEKDLDSLVSQYAFPEWLWRALNRCAITKPRGNGGAGIVTQAAIDADGVVILTSQRLGIWGGKEAIW